MGKSDSSNKNNVRVQFGAAPNRPNWVVGAVCFLAGVLMLAALWDYRPEQSGYMGTIVTENNLVGNVGAFWVFWASKWLGVAVWLVPVFLLRMCFLAVRYSRGLTLGRWVAVVFCVVSGAGLAAMFGVFESDPARQVYNGGVGGELGRMIYDYGLRDTFGVFGSGVMMGLVYAVGLVVVLTRDIVRDLERGWLALRGKLAEWRRARAEEAALRREAKELARKQALEAKEAARQSSVKVPVIMGGVKKEVEVPTTRGAVVKKDEKKEELSAAVAKAVEKKEEKKGEVKREGKLELKIVQAEMAKKAKGNVSVPTMEGNYVFPTVKLLKEFERPSVEDAEEEHRVNAERLLKAFEEFGVKVNLGEIHVGPVITCYEVSPAQGVRVSDVTKLENDIALRMAAQSVRILGQIPGKSAIGVEVPNRVASPVGLREIIESVDWVNMKAELPVALGKDISGKPVISDLTKMPHLLIAGATGSGKSVCVNSIVASILYSKSPAQVRLIMVDPKVVELKVFNALPHMLIPVVTEPKKVPGALKWLLSEMALRYQMFAQCGVRNIIGFNERKKSGAGEFPVEKKEELEGLEGEQVELPEKLPYIVVIIDELADLMMVAKNEVEGGVARLAQLARAAGIHLIIATQRPSVNVITGLIKANLPSRIAFQVASQVDSRTILDGKGAEMLIGKGDMLFSPPASSLLVRAQGAFVSDNEVVSIVEFLKQNGPPQYAQAVQEQIDRAAEDDEEGEDGEEMDGGGDDEELMKQAVKVVKEAGKASVSLLQRKLRIGYGRAARIMDLMEDRGIVGPDNGTGPREIFDVEE